MAFDQSTILDVRAARVDAELAVSWDSSSPAGTAFQVYADRVLSWHGTARRCVLPHPRALARIEVGTVLPAEASADLSGSLPTPPGGGQRVTLRWAGGTYLDPAIASFRVFVWPSGGSMPATPAGVVPAYLAGVVTDGFGVGGFGSGGFGHAAASYEWTSAPLAAGTWAYAVVPVDSAGNAGTPSAGTATVAGPPRPPARNAAGNRLAYQYKFGTPGGFGTGGFGMGGYGTGAGFGSGGFGVGGYGVGAGDGLPYLTLSWLASPGY